MEVKMISWNISMIVEFCFDIVIFKEQMEIYQFSNLMLIWLSLVMQNNMETKLVIIYNHHFQKYNINEIIDQKPTIFYMKPIDIFEIIFTNSSLILVKESKTMVL
jgi:hypothetical protein